MKDITTLGIDLAKDVFQLHGSDKRDKTVLKKRLSRQKLIEFMAKLPSCVVGIEACGGAHYWARQLSGFGHTAKIMAPQFVKPYVKSNKHDAADAQACNEAVRQEHMRFVSTKTIEQQDMQILHRIRSQLVDQRTQLSNQIRGFLLEFGITLAKGKRALSRLAEILAANKDKISAKFAGWMLTSYERYQALDKQIKAYEDELKAQVKESEQLQNLMTIPGIGVLTATALLSGLGSGEEFYNGRQVSAWLGLTPRECSSGNTRRLFGITKRGDRYLRTLLVHGARAFVKTVADKKDAYSLWVQQLLRRMPHNKVCVAVANKNARIFWALLRSGEVFKADKAVDSISPDMIVNDELLKEAA